MKTTVILLRHGQTEWNRLERLRGRADVPLNDTGLKQAEATGRRVAAAWRPVAIYSSPLSRAVKTAETIGGYAGLKVEIHPGLADIDYGDWQGLTSEELLSRYPEMGPCWYRTPQLAQIPGGENLEAVRSRAIQTVEELVARHPGQTIVLVGHTVVNRIILLGVLGLGNERFWHIRQEPCAINIFEAEAGDYTLVSMNDGCHLNDLHPV
ncbi:MAG TPA: histidine phosphatase family protein [Anaerolineales bacterium]|nr:histidine phosphatase family protein [Anaerolineales bacterium]